MDETDPNHPIQNLENVQDEKYYTVCLVFDPERATSLKSHMAKVNKLKSVVSKKMVYYDEKDITANTFEQKLAMWATEFNSTVGEKYCLRRPRFSELRPGYLKNLWS